MVLGVGITGFCRFADEVNSGKRQCGGESADLLGIVLELFKVRFRRTLKMSRAIQSREIFQDGCTKHREMEVQMAGRTLRERLEGRELKVFCICNLFLSSCAGKYGQ